MTRDSGRTKVVVRHLPPSITQAVLMDPIDAAFSDRYDWVSFRPGKSRKHLAHSRAYINFKRPEDVTEFAAFFEGHTFVNEKGFQFKPIVEYAPSQRVPAQHPRRDGREGTVLTDPAYLEFLKFLAKPSENLPSAEIQLERREADLSGVAEGVPVVTPLMDFIRRKRASKCSSASPKSNQRAGKSLVGTSTLLVAKRNKGKRRISSTKNALKDTARSSSSKEKAVCDMIPNGDGVQPLDKSSALERVCEAEPDDTNATSGPGISSKKKIPLSRGKERGLSKVFGGMSPQLSQVKHIVDSSTSKHHKQCEGDWIVRRLLINKDESQGTSGIHLEKGKMSSRSSFGKKPIKDANSIGVSDVVVRKDMPGNGNEKLETQIRNKYKRDRAARPRLDFSEGSNARLRISVAYEGQSDSVRNADSLAHMNKGKSPKKGGTHHEKQVWVQKSSSGS